MGIWGPKRVEVRVGDVRKGVRVGDRVGYS